MSERTWLARTSWARRPSGEGLETTGPSRKTASATIAAAAMPATAHEDRHPIRFGNCCHEIRCGNSRTGADARRPAWSASWRAKRSEEHTSELQSQSNLVCRLLLEKKKKNM